MFDASFASHVAQATIAEADHAMGQDGPGKLAHRNVPATTVDSITQVNGLKRLDFIKIDVGGHESEVILGASHALALFQPIIFMEFNSWTTIVYGRRNPMELLTFLHDRFPYVYEVVKDAGNCLKEMHATDADRFSFLARNIFQHGCVDDLVLSYRPLHLRDYSSSSKGNEEFSERDTLVDLRGDAQETATLPRKLNVGCGYDKRAGYLNIDIDPAVEPDILIKDHDLSVLPKGHFEEVLANDVLEHIPRDLTMHALLDWAALLSPGGVLTLRTSSILGIAELMQDHPAFEFQFNWTSCLFGNQQHPGDFHYTGFTERTLRVHLVCVGFEVTSLDLRDGWLFEAFAIKVWDWTDLIRRSEGNDDTQFLIAAYQEFFNRELDDVGRLHWGGQLRTGQSRYDVLKGIVGSREHLYKRAAKLAL